MSIEEIRSVDRAWAKFRADEGWCAPEASAAMRERAAEGWLVEKPTTLLADLSYGWGYVVCGLAVLALGFLGWILGGTW